MPEHAAPKTSPTGASLPRRLLWFFALWAAGVLAVGLVGLAIKLALGV